MCFITSHLKLPQLVLGGDVGNEGGVRGADSLLGQSQPGVQVGVFFHKLVPEDPPPLQPANTEKDTQPVRLPNQGPRVQSEVLMEDTHCPHPCRSPSWLQPSSTCCVSSSFRDEEGRKKDEDRSMSLTSCPGMTSLPAAEAMEGGLSGGNAGILTSRDLHLERNKARKSFYLHSLTLFLIFIRLRDNILYFQSTKTKLTQI